MPDKNKKSNKNDNKGKKSKGGDSIENDKARIDSVLDADSGSTSTERNI